MKNLILILFWVSAIFGNAQNVILAGKIEYPNSDTLSLNNSNFEYLRTIHLKKDGTFKDEFSVAEGYYWLNDGKERTEVYLQPDFNLYLTLNTKQFDETVFYKGKGANENNYIVKKLLLEESFGKLEYYGYYGKLKEDEFLQLEDSLYKIKCDLLHKDEIGFTKEFAFKEAKSLEFEHLNKLADYEAIYRFVADDKNFKVSAHYPNPYVGLNVSDESLLVVDNYLSLVKSYMRAKANEKFKEDTTQSYSILYLNVILKEEQNGKIKNDLIYSFVDGNLASYPNLDSLYNLAKPFISDEKQLAEITEKYNRLKKIEKGAISPVFSFKDISGKEVSLTDFKGKVVYIDIWATWCLPCMKEIPELQKKEEEFKGKSIAFVSICTWDQKERWEKMVKEKSLSGIQLFAPDKNVSFFNDYILEGIPRFILIDKDGKIVNANAKRPSDEKLREELKSLL